MGQKIISSNIYDLLNYFTKREIELFTSFIHSDYLNKDQKVRTLLSCLLQMKAANLDYTKVQQCNIFRAVFPEKKVKQSQLDAGQIMLLNAKNNLLYKKAKQFLCLEELQQNRACETELLYAALLKKKQSKMMLRELNKDKKVLAETQRQGTGFYNYAVQVEQYLLQYYYQENLILKKDNLQELSHFLDARYVIQKLEFELTALSLSRAVKAKSYDLKTQQAIAGLMKLPHCAQNSLIQIYQLAIRLTVSDEHDSYLQLLDLLRKKNNMLSDNVLNNFYVVAVNFCARQLRKGDLRYNRFLFELYKLLDAKNLLLEGNHLPLRKLKNIVVMSCKVGEYEWAAQVIEQYRPSLNKLFAKSACYFGYGLIAFYQQKYKEAISNLIRVEKTTPGYAINARSLQLKCHYELDQSYDLKTIRVFRTTAQFVKNHKLLSGTEKKAARNFIRLLVNLYNRKHHAGKKTVQDIRNRLKGFDYVDDKKWLEEKLKELEG